MKTGKIENINIQKVQKNNLINFDKIKNTSSKIKLSIQNSPKTKIIKAKGIINKNKYQFNKKTKLNSNINIIINSNLNTNSILYKPKLHKNRTHSKYKITKKENTNINININSHFQTCNNTNKNSKSYVNIHKVEKKILDYDNPFKNNNNNYNKNELNISNVLNNKSGVVEQNNNNINSNFETNNSSDNNNFNKEHNDYFSLNKSKNSIKKISISKSNSLNNSESNSNGKNKNLINMEKFQNKNLFHEYKANNAKNINKNNIYQSNNMSFIKSMNTHSLSYSNVNITNSKNKSKSKSKTNILLNDSKLTPYNNKNNKNSYLTKPIIKNLSPSKRPFIITNSNSKIFKDKERIDVQITSINNLLNNKFIKELNNIQNELDRNLKLNQANSKYKKYNTIKQFFEKFIKKLNEYLNKNAFNCINNFLQKIINGYNEIIISFSSENKNIQKQNIKLNQKIEEFQKKIKEAEKNIYLLKEKNIELINQFILEKSEIKDNSNIGYEKYDLDDDDNSKKNRNNEGKYVSEEQNLKVFKLNEKNLDDLDALYFFDKIKMDNKRATSKRIPLIPIKENNEENKRRKTFSKKINDTKNKDFLKIKKAFE